MITPKTIKLAKKLGAVDSPKDERRINKVVMPRLGGVAVVCGFLISIIYLLISLTLEIIRTAKIGDPFKTNTTSIDTQEIIEIPEDNPSSPSIKLIAFVKPTIQHIVINNVCNF